MRLSDTARLIYEHRYLKQDSSGNLLETPEELISRVAATMAAVEGNYGKDALTVKSIEEDFYNMMINRLFLPNSPTLLNCGKELQQLSACFVLPLEDSMESIFITLKNMALIQKTGGGTGFAFNRIRPRGAEVRTSGAVASGPVSFLKVFDVATGTVKQGGARSGANMGSLTCHHPDIIDFICCKESETEITNFNLSVTVTDSFMEKASGENPDPNYTLINPETGRPALKPETGKPLKLNAVEILDLIAEKAWSNGEPGLIFIDRMNQYNPTPLLGYFETTNPCGEQPLLPYEACCLGSLNLNNFVTADKRVDWEKLRKTVHTATRFLDNVIEASHYVIKDIAEMHRYGNRKVGLGVMGWHDMLVRLGIQYDSEEAILTAEQVMAFINNEAKKESVKLAVERGVFPNFRGSIYDNGKPDDRVRNATRTTIAPTGTISILTGASSGIEPYFSLAFTRNNILGEKNITEINPLLIETVKKVGFFHDGLIEQILHSGRMPQGANFLEYYRSLFKTALEIGVEWHVRHQAAFQKYTDNAVSKTVNLPQLTSVEDVKRIYITAWQLSCKGITVYRDRSREQQVLNRGITADRCSERANIGSSCVRCDDNPFNYC